MKKKVSDEAFVAAYGNLDDPMDKLNATQKDNRKVMHKIASRYTKYLTKQQIKDCMLKATWRCLENHEEGMGNKFTTSLWKFTNWEIKREIHKTFKKSSGPQVVSFSNLGKKFDLGSEEVSDNVKSIKECIYLLPDEDKELIQEYYFEKYTMKEIGERHSYSKEAARQKIKKAIAKLKEMYLSRNSPVYS